MPPLRGQAAVERLRSDAGLDRLTPGQRGACTNWTSNLFWLVQNYLWETEEARTYGSVELRVIERVVSNLDAAFEALSGTSEQIVVYRGTPFAPSEGPMRGYVSCSARQAVAEAVATSGGSVWEILVPAGAPALYLPAVSEAASDDLAEVLLPRGIRFILEAVRDLETERRLTTLRWANELTG
jgi:hypothetical protein